MKREELKQLIKEVIKEDLNEVIEPDRPAKQIVKQIDLLMRALIPPELKRELAALKKKLQEYY